MAGRSIEKRSCSMNNLLYGISKFSSMNRATTTETVVASFMRLIYE